MRNNGTMMQYFHWYYGNSPHDPDLWKKVTAEAVNLAAAGITALWLPPPYKANHYDPSGQQVHDRHSVGYDIYDLYDLGEFDQKGSVRTKYGQKEEYLGAIKAAQLHGVHVYGDVVFNHKAGADKTEWVKAYRVKEKDRNEIIEELWIEAWTEFTCTGRDGRRPSLPLRSERTLRALAPSTDIARSRRTILVRPSPARLRTASDRRRTWWPDTRA